MSPTLSIVIVSWNTRELLSDCLESVYRSLASTPELTAEVYVADNASSDGSPELVRERFSHVKLIETGENLGFAKANNIALKQASGTYWLLLNSDTLVPDGALAGLAAALEAHPDAAVAGPTLLNGNGSLQVSWARFPGLRSELSGALDRSQAPESIEEMGRSDVRHSLAAFACDWVGGAAFLVRASMARGPLFGLDEAFFMYAEETEWCLRFARAGYKTIFVPSVEVVHLGGGSSRAVPTATRKRMWQSSLRFYRLASGAIGSLPACAVSTARMALYPLKNFRSQA